MGIKTVVLHSGGLDSTTCLLLAIERGRDVLSLGIRYGQRHSIELDYAEAQSKQLRVPRKVLQIEWSKPVRQLPVGRKVVEMSQKVSPAFLPGRNVVFLALACAEAAGQEANEVWIGVNAVDFSGYPDCRPEFIDAFSHMMNIAVPEGPSIVAPLLSMSKPEIAALAYRLGLRKGDTWSCYRPSLESGTAHPCGRCDACVLHEYAWSEGAPGDGGTGGLLASQGTR